MSACLDRLKSFAGCSDIVSLQSEVRDLCMQFGNVKSIDVLTVADAKNRHALCFLRLESDAQELALIEALKACRFGNDVLIIVDLPPHAGHRFPRTIAESPGLA